MLFSLLSWLLSEVCQTTQLIHIFSRVRVLHLDSLKEGTWLHSFDCMYRFWFNSIMVQRNVLKKVEIIVLFTLLLILVIGETKITNKTRKCLTKCEQCKRHYGYLFWAHLCTRTCFNHEGRIHINCQNFNSISDFLSGSYWYIRYFGGSYWKTSIQALF